MGNNSGTDVEHISNLLGGLSASVRIRRRSLRHFPARWTQCDPIGLHSIPVLNQEAVGLEQLPNARTLPSRNLLQDWYQCSQRVIAEYGPLGNLSDVLRLRHGDSESVAPVDMQHHVNVGTAVADVHDVGRRNPQLFLELIQPRDLAITGRGTHQAFDLALCAVLELRAETVVLGTRPSSADLITSTGAAEST